MAEEFQAGLCGGNRWSLPKNMLIGGGSSPCSTADLGCGSYGSWLVTDVVDHLKPKSSPRKDSTNNINNFSLSNHSSLVYEESHHQVTDNSDHNLNFHVMDFGNLSSCSSSSSSDWTCQTLLRRNLKPNEDLSLDQKNVRQTIARESLSYGHTSNKIQGLLEVDLQPQQAVFSESTINYSTPTSYGTMLNELSPAWSKLGPFIKAPPSTEEQKSIDGGLHFTNNTTFWSASASASTNYITGSSFVQPNNSQPQFVMTTYEEKPSCSLGSSKPNKEQDPDSKSVVKRGIEPAIKRARIETPSRLPTFKVRKEKLGDRITALQQLVSPFGKTDTASVLHEAIGCIKFLHDQVGVLSTPYMKNGNPVQNHQIEKQEPVGLKQDLRSRGLCLVPISSTCPVAHDTTPDIWTPTFGATFR